MDYRLCWALNKSLNLQLKKQDDYLLNIYKSKQSVFSKYTFCDEIQKINYTVLANKGSDALLAKEFAMVDYFLLIEGYYESVDQEKFLQDVKGTSFVITSFMIDPNTLHSKDNFILE